YECDLVADRFRDTWTKLRVFDMDEFNVSSRPKYLGSLTARAYGGFYPRPEISSELRQRIIMVDADIVLFQSIDELFALQLPADHWIAASHACVCNKKRAAWGSKRPDWNEKIVPIRPSNILKRSLLQPALASLQPGVSSTVV